MAAKKGATPTAPAPMYGQLLLFPERAEYLAEDRFDAYRVSLGHWRALAEHFREAFETVYTRGSARVLLVHGGQGHGKSLFVRTLVDAFASSKKTSGVDEKNLWHVLAGGSPLSAETIRRAADTTVLRQVEPRAGWLAAERAFAREDEHAIRVYLFDDAQKDLFVREWADLSQGEYAKLRAEGHRGVALSSVAERIVEDLRGDFRRALFVLLSNDAAHLDTLKLELERSHQGLAKQIELPLPAPATKEEIVRTNTNLLNPRSYWFCLDKGGPDEKTGAYETLSGDRGFVDSFAAISRALGAQQRGQRAGRPANKNLITLVTLGTSPPDVASFLADHDLEADEVETQAQLGVWWLRNRWASALSTGPDGADSRQSSLVESEFSLRWVTLGMAATWVLCEGANDDPLAAKLCALLSTAPSIADAKQAKHDRKETISAVDAGLESLAGDPRVAAFERSFTDMGSKRSEIYEPAIARRLGRDLSHGLSARASLKPDVILEEYEPCAVTRATSGDEQAIKQAIKRSCHVVEMTAFLQPDLRGLEAYLGEKVRVYAELLESV